MPIFEIFGFKLVALMSCLILLQYLVFSMLTGKARAAGNVQAPAVSGDEAFERMFRVQTNTLEQLIIVLPIMWLFALLVNPLFAAIGGGLFFVGRFVYMKGYTTDPAKRGPGMIIGMLPTIVMLLWTLVDVILSLL